MKASIRKEAWQMRDVHVQIDESQYEKFRLAVEKLGYRTMSAFLREQIRAIIQRAEEATK